MASDNPGAVHSDGERIAVLAIPQLELAIEVDTPQVIGVSAGREQRSGGLTAPLSRAADKTVSVENGVDGAFCRDPDIAWQASDKELADLAGTPNGASRS